MKRALALVFVLPLGAGAQSPVHATAHYDLVAEAGDAKDIGAMLEALYGHLSRYFGRAPRERLRVEFYATFDGFAAALRRDRQPEIKAGGYYSPVTKTAYLFAQPSEYYTRQLILHEATHQFHYLAATGNRSVSPFWYAEGLAEYFGMHNWDGSELRVCVVPALSLEDYPARALTQLTALKDDAQGIGTAAVPVERPLAWALVSFLAGRFPDRWRALAAKLDDGEKPEKAWEKCVGEAGPEFAKQFRAWIEEHQQPFRILWVSWQERGDRIEGRSDACGVALVRKPGDRLEACVEAKTGALNAGLLLNRTGDRDYVLVRAQEGRVSLVRRAAGKDAELAFVESPGPAAALVAVREGDEWVVRAAGKELGRVPAAGDAGLFAEGCGASFKVAR
jgi:hypothetical protein